MAYRKEKIEEQIRRIISEVLLKEIKDPRIGFTTLTSVTISKDYSFAKVGISVLGDKNAMRKTLAGINSAKGFIQFKVGKGLGIRQMPKLSFFLDTSIAEGVEMVALLNQLNQEAQTEEEHKDIAQEDQ